MYFLLEDKDLLVLKINTMAAADLASLGAKPSTALVST